MQAKIDKQLGSYIQGINEKIKMIEEKAKFYSPDRHKYSKYRAIHRLRIALSDALGKTTQVAVSESKEPMSQKTDLYKAISEFRDASLAAINKAEPVLNTPSWFSFFKNLLFIILPPLAMAISVYSICTGYYPFFKSRSEIMIAETLESINASFPCPSIKN